METNLAKIPVRKAGIVVGSILLFLLIAAAIMLLFTQQTAQAQESNGYVFSDVQTVNGMTVSAGNYRLLNNRVMATVCYDKPTSDDWSIWEAEMEYDGKQPPEWSTEWIQAASAPPTGIGKLCDVVSFPVPPDTPVHNFTITIKSIAAYPREGQECSPEYLQSFQKVLDERGTGIKVDCIHQEGIQELVVAGKPDAMRMEEAQSILSDKDLFLSIRGRKGPWIFKGHFE